MYILHILAQLPGLKGILCESANCLSVRIIGIAGTFSIEVLSVVEIFTVFIVNYFWFLRKMVLRRFSITFIIILSAKAFAFLPLLGEAGESTLTSLLLSPAAFTFSSSANAIIELNSFMMTELSIIPRLRLIRKSFQILIFDLQLNLYVLR